MTVQNSRSSKILISAFSRPPRFGNIFGQIDGRISLAAALIRSSSLPEIFQSVSISICRRWENRARFFICHLKQMFVVSSDFGDGGIGNERANKLA
jgi:predicted acylesterase/phospholipase RssA